ncbi:MAG TPA: hypothetical protein VI564_00660 [Candidatus Nanoarchaeia archaeon]|nr:hypothetical protein [Candidatus Nanoarchaeia archaeon]
MQFKKNTKFFLPVFIVFLIISLAGCKKPDAVPKKPEILHFQSGKYGFSFDYPSEFEEVTRDLPDKWALIDGNKNTMLFVVNKAEIKDIRSLAMSQALRDLHNGSGISQLKKEDIEQVMQNVKFTSFNNNTWYTYGMKFSDKDVESLISGILCGDEEIVFVLVNDAVTFDIRQQIYSKMLESFKC